MNSVLRFGIYADREAIAYTGDCVKAIRIAQGYSNVVGYDVDVTSSLTGEVIATFRGGILTYLASIDYNGDAM